MKFERFHLAGFSMFSCFHFKLSFYLFALQNILGWGGFVFGRSTVAGPFQLIFIFSAPPLRVASETSFSILAPPLRVAFEA